MCFNEDEPKSQICSCHHNLLNNPAFWSKEKKIVFLEEHLECLQKKITETMEAINELKK